MALPLALYRGATRLLGPFLSQRVARRLAAQSVPAPRIAERQGRATLPRPPGTLVWIHAASVGESLSVLPLIDALLAARDDLSVLVTTGTATSAEILARRLPPRAIHQFAPLDTVAAIGRFFAHWRPDLLVTVESELWPNMLFTADRHSVPRALVNARLSPGSLRNWARFPATARAILAPFRVVTVQYYNMSEALRSLGADPVRVTGDMKAASAPPPADPATLAALRAGIGSRPLWAAVSTHPGEEAAALAAHEHVRARHPGALLLLCPRHPERRSDIMALHDGMPLRSRGEVPGDAPVWLLDTMGETGLWFRLAPVTFLGGSLTPIGGHNPWEPAQCGTALLHGPHVASAAPAHAALDAAGAALPVTTETLGPTVADLLSDPARAAAMGAAGQATAATQASAVPEVARALLDLLPPAR